MGDRVLGVIEIVPAGALSFYNYEAKYAPGGSRHLLPAPVSSNVYELVQKLTLTAHKALGCRGVSRADFRYDDTPGGTGELICLEVNTQPGMTVDLAGAGTGGARGTFVRRVGQLDGGGGELQQVGTRPDIGRRASQSPAPHPVLDAPLASLGTSDLAESAVARAAACAETKRITSDLWQTGQRRDRAGRGYAQQYCRA